MLLPYLQVNAADYAHEREHFEMKKLLQNINRKKRERSLEFIAATFCRADVCCMA